MPMRAPRFDRKCPSGFSIPRFGTTDQPELFRRPAGALWRDLGDTGGDVCPPYVPLPLIKVWQLKPAGGGCYY